jgi:hypothetical protein
MTQVAPPAPEHDPGMTPGDVQPPVDDRLAFIRSLREGVRTDGTEGDWLSGTPEYYGADTTRTATAFAHVRQSDAAPHQGSEDEKYVMQLAAGAYNPDAGIYDTKTLHALSRGEHPDVDVVEAIELGKTAAEARLGAISLKYADQEAKGIAPVPVSEEGGDPNPRVRRGGKVAVPPGAGKQDRLFVPNTSIYVTDKFYEHHDML